MRRLWAQLLRYLFPDRQAPRSTADERWQVAASSGRHVRLTPRYTPPPPPRQSPMIAVWLPRSEWMAIASILTWGGTTSPHLVRLRVQIDGAVAMTRPPAGPDTQWDLDIIDGSGWGNG